MSTLARFTILAVYSFAIAVWIGCSHNDNSTVSVSDASVSETPAGPWNLVLLEVNPHHLLADSDGIDLIDEVIGQTSELSRIRLQADICAGETLLLRIAYREAWSPEGSVEVRLLLNDQEVASKRTALRRSSTGFRVTAPELGANLIEIRYRLAPGTTIPLKSVIGISMFSGAPAVEEERARRLLRWAVRATARNASNVLKYRKFPLLLEGCIRHCTAIVGGDTLVLDVPGVVEQAHAEFSVAGFRRSPDSDARLCLQALSRGKWKLVATWSLDNIGTNAWFQCRVAKPAGSSWQRIRFSLSSPEGVLAVTEPFLRLQEAWDTDKLNLILLDLDTMRADRLGCYGYTERPTSIRLDSLFEERGFLVFSRAYSTAPYTLPATASFFTSRYRDITEQGEVPSYFTTLAEVLAREGYYCAGITGGGFLAAPGFEQGFHEYYCTGGLGKVEDIFPKATTWLAQGLPTPFFLFVHTYETHGPYTRGTFCRDLPHGRLGNLHRGEPMPKGGVTEYRLTPAESLYIEAAYDGGVRMACDATASLLSVLEELGLWRNSVVIVLSDHGEEFCEHFEVYGVHDHSLYGELLNVPFVIYSPNHSSNGIRNIDTEVSLADLLPTVADLLKIDLQTSCDGMSLKPAIQNKSIEREVPIMAMKGRSSRSVFPRVCVIANGAKYIEPRGDADEVNLNVERDRIHYSWKNELFLLDQDPKERHNLVDVDLKLAKEMKQLLKKGLSLTGVSGSTEDTGLQRTTLSPRLKRQLEALGYLDD